MLNKIFITLFSVLILSGCSSSFFSLEDPWESENQGEFTEEEQHFDREQILQAQNYATPTRPFLTNSNWKVSHIDGQRINPTYNLTLHFRKNIYNKHDFLVSGLAGCNSFQGHLSLEIMQGKLTTDTDFRTTRHHCEDSNLLATEGLYLETLFKNSKIEQNGENSIILFHYDRKLTLQRL